MCSDVVIRAEGVGKCYQIYARPRDRLLQMLARGRRQYFQEFWALRELSFEVRRGEVVGLIGSNGSGKSTLLQLLCGTLNQTIGSVEVFGRVAALLELGAGFNPEYTGRENVYLCASLYGLSHEQIGDRFDRIAEFADIGEFIDQPVKIYSSGMFVRLAFAIIAHVDADILVIDEALAVGDVFFVQKCMRFLRAFAKTGTLFFVSHDIAAVVGLCSRVMLLKAGQLIRMGDPKDVSSFYLAQMNAGRTSLRAPESNPAGGDAPPSPGDEGFDADTGHEFGSGKSRIDSVRLEDESGRHIAAVSGGERVRLVISAVVLRDYERPLMGFLVKDRLGQSVFGANTYGMSDASLEMAVARTRVVASFDFNWPTLASGDYSVCVSSAEGDPVAHEHHHWANDAVIVRCQPSVHCAGIFDVPMVNVCMDVDDNAARSTQQ